MSKSIETLQAHIDEQAARIAELTAALDQSIEAMVSELNERGHITEDEICNLRDIANPYATKEKDDG